ncbi:hypothetical protein ACTWP6_15470 [Mycobacterium sp. 4D054]|uniref:hypothetical protein n=1 Tax=unclassified Mycobacterium TaxID=2642494 RepID=UPI0021B45931|nr:hypothetical protein [Mycobacterium sp. SMC-8]UXA15490.1 hypothetical protein KXD97_23540 [Mycobacterium sp. SMC-8]
MSVHRCAFRRAALAATASLACVPWALAAAPTATSAPPPYDGQGYLDSTARCAAPATLVVFGSTAGSRVAICRDTDGDYQYRGVRIRDGARLITSATQSPDGAFTATNDGVDYMVTSEALVISVGEKVIRDEPMVDFHRAGSSAPSTTSPRTPSSTSTPAPSSTAKPTPLPPPLPAEVGGAEADGSTGG